MNKTPTTLDAESLARCQSAMEYVEDMSVWYDEDVEDVPKAAYVRQILDQIAKRGDLTPSERAWCETELDRRYGS